VLSVEAGQTETVAVNALAVAQALGGTLLHLALVAREAVLADALGFATVEQAVGAAIERPLALRKLALLVRAVGASEAPVAVALALVVIELAVIGAIEQLRPEQIVANLARASAKTGPTQAGARARLAGALF